MLAGADPCEPALELASKRSMASVKKATGTAGAARMASQTAQARKDGAIPPHHPNPRPNFGLRINAEGEEQAAQKLLEAARILGQAPEAMQLRYLSTLNVLASEKSSTIVFPFPMELRDFFAGSDRRDVP
jgi:regulator of protease activity HflC (stomatin/prohibitin superfamily)